ncbi:MAG: class B sortase [Proteocatella sp.]
MKTHKSKNKWIYALFFYILLGLSVFLVYNISSDVYSRYTGNKMYEELKDKKPVPPSISQQASPSASIPLLQKDSEPEIPKKDNLQMLRELKEKNSDTIAWIEIPGTMIDYPVMQSADNKYYLRKTFGREYNILGSIFADYRNAPSFDDQNTVLYGHNMKDGSMFYDITFLKNQDFYDKYNSITVSLDDRILEYTLFSVYEVNKDYDYRSPHYDKYHFENLLAELKAKSIIQSDIVPTSEDKILTLSTCSYSFNNARLVAHAVLTNVTEFKAN